MCNLVLALSGEFSYFLDTDLREFMTKQMSACDISFLDLPPSVLFLKNEKGELPWKVTRLIRSLIF